MFTNKCLMTKACSIEIYRKCWTRIYFRGFDWQYLTVWRHVSNFVDDDLWLCMTSRVKLCWWPSLTVYDVTWSNFVDDDLWLCMTSRGQTLLMTIFDCVWRHVVNLCWWTRAVPFELKYNCSMCSWLFNHNKKGTLLCISGSKLILHLTFFFFAVGKYGIGSFKTVLGIGNAPRT